MISSLERLRRRVRGQIRDWIQDAASAVARRWRQLPLRTRLTTFAAAAVAVAVIAVSVAAILVIREQLLGQFNRDLLDQARYVARHMAETVPDTRSRISGDVPLLQVLRVDGTVARPENQATTLPVSGRDLDVVAGGSDVEYSDVRVDGVRYRMVTIDAPGGALQFARQPIEVEDRLAQYTLLLVVIGAVGVVSAAMLGMTVARAGLAPVDRLTAAAEHVAATQDLRAAITVTGDDEVARLGRAFNAMLAALESSREDQRRLIDDASHELR
ncbi:MAG TPA: HAMP domain-containing protein, partial [Kribbellaceae bacterium]